MTDLQETQKTQTLEKWDVSSMRDNKDGIIVIIGKRASGKSYLIANLLKYLTNVPYGTVVCGNDATDMYGTIFGSNEPNTRSIFDKYAPIILETAWRRQCSILEAHKKANPDTYTQSQQDLRTFIALDDCICDINWTTDKLMRTIFMGSRSWKTTLILALQYPVKIPPLLRSNIKLLFIMNEQANQNRQNLWESYVTRELFPNFDLFCKAMDSYTHDYKCLVVDYRTTSINRISWYKSDL